jgi:hypothetical protein
MFRLPIGLLWRKKEVLELGGGKVVTTWDFRRATETGRLVGTLIPGRTYHKYRRDAVCKAFGIRCCDVEGREADVLRAEYAELI